MTLEHGLYQYEINNYFFFNRHIDNAYANLEDLRYRHDNRNYYTRTTYDDLGFHTQGFNMEHEVNDYVGAEDLILERIKRLEARQRRFNELLDQLHPDDRNYLVMRYKQNKRIKERPDVEEKALSIVEEMEEYKFQLSRYKEGSFKKTGLVNSQQQRRKEFNEKMVKAESDHKYSEWLEGIMEDEELAKKWENNGILERLMKLE